MENAFCTIISKLRLYQGITLYQSLEVNCPKFTLFILCMDDESYIVCTAFNMTKAVLIKLYDIEDSALLNVKNSRKINEYCWTIKPFLIQHVLQNYVSVIQVAYIDADICFFNDPTVIFERQPESTVLLSEHDYLNRITSVEIICGKYNSGLIIFKRNSISWNALQWWKHSCLEWCYDRAEEGKFGDQKYLDYLPSLFEKVKTISMPGVNIAPWNEAKYHFKIINNNFYINNNLLICYHFCGVRILSMYEYILALGNNSINDLVITPYMKVVQQIIQETEKKYPHLRCYSEFENVFIRLKKYKIR